MLEIAQLTISTQLIKQAASKKDAIPPTLAVIIDYYETVAVAQSTSATDVAITLGRTHFVLWNTCIPMMTTIIRLVLSFPHFLANEKHSGNAVSVALVYATRPRFGSEMDSKDREARILLDIWEVLDSQSGDLASYLSNEIGKLDSTRHILSMYDPTRL